MRLLTCGLVAASGLFAGQSGEDSAFQALIRTFLNDLTRNNIGVDHPEIHDYVGQIAQKLSTDCHSGALVTVHILVNEDPNVSALPGRHLIVHTGFLQRVRSEAALAGALAQILFQSIAFQPEERKILWLGSPYLLYESRFPGTLSSLRARILEADRGAATCLLAAGYDPAELPEDLRLQSVPGDFHAERIRRLEAQIHGLSRTSAALILTSSFLEMQSRLSVLLRLSRPPTLRANRQQSPE